MVQTSSLGSAEFLLFSLFTSIARRVRYAGGDKKVSNRTRATRVWAADSPTTGSLRISPHRRRKLIPLCLRPPRTGAPAERPSEGFHISSVKCSSSVAEVLEPTSNA